MAETSWIEVVNTDFLKVHVSCEIQILTCMLYPSLSQMTLKKFPCTYWITWKYEYLMDEFNLKF